jgi:hypothetical protein
MMAFACASLPKILTLELQPAQQRRHDGVELDNHAVACCKSLQESVVLLVREQAHLLQQVRVQHLGGGRQAR